MEAQGIIEYECFSMEIVIKSSPVQEYLAQTKYFDPGPNLFWTCRRTEQYSIEAPSNKSKLFMI